MPLNLLQKLKSVDLLDYVSKQIRYSLGNTPSIPLGIAVIYGLVQFGHLWYIWASLISWVISTGINFNVQRLLKVVVTGMKKDYSSKLARFYIGSAPLVPLGTAVLYAVTQYGHVFYLLSVVVSMIATTLVGMVIQTKLKVIKVKRHEEPTTIQTIA